MTLPLLLVLGLFHIYWTERMPSGSNEFPLVGDFVFFVIMLFYQIGVLWRRTPARGSAEQVFPELDIKSRTLIVQSSQASMQGGLIAATIVLSVGITALSFVLSSEGSFSQLLVAHFAKALLWAALSVVGGVWSLFSIPTQALTLDIRVSRSITAWVYIQFNSFMISALRMFMGAYVIMRGVK